MEASFDLMGKSDHMKFWGVYSTLDIINFCLPPFLLIMGDANMYQRFFASKSAEGAKYATKVLILAVAIAELMIIIAAWISSSMIPDAEVGKYVLIYASHEFLPTFIGAIMMTTIVGIIISTADSFLLVPATTLMRDIYLNYINPKEDEKKIVKGNPNSDNFEFYINPRIDHYSKKSIQEGEEGCLSIPEIRLVAERYDKIKVRYFNRDGKKIKKPLSGFMSRVFQHELDHLEGKLMVENNKIKNVYRISENENIQTLYSNLIKELSSF